MSTIIHPASVPPTSFRQPSMNPGVAGLPDARSKTRPPAGLEMLVTWEPTRSSPAGFYSGLDMATGTVRVMGSGIWREADAERYHAQQRRIVAEARRRFGTLKVFFDVREWIVEGPQSATQFQGANSDIYLPDDRLVAVVASSLLKQHPRTALSVGAPESFLSVNAAETWLHAYSSGSEAA